MDYSLTDIYNRAQICGYKGPLDVLCIFEWLFDKGYACFPDNPKKGLYGTGWMINFYRNCEFVGYKGSAGPFKNALLDGLNWALREYENKLKSN